MDDPRSDDSPSGCPDRARFVAEQRRFNEETAPFGHAFAAHRERLTRLVLGTPRSASARLCLLGAGNANDVELDRVASAFAEVHLVDLDAQALRGALRRWRLSSSPSVVCHGDADLSGILGLLEAYRQRRPAPGSERDRQAIDAMVAACRSSPAPGPAGPFDVLVSCCLLSQMIDAAAEALGPEHPRVHELAVELRRRHLRDMVHRLAPSGHGWLVTDFVASTTVPVLAAIEEHELADEALRLIRAGNFFLGLNPFVLFDELQREPWFAARCEQVTLLRPWRWDMGIKQFLVTGIGFRRRAEVPPSAPGS